jgi:hypothetical protein
MKTIACLLLLITPVLAHATDIHPGDSLATVEAALGTPNGQAQLGDKLVLDYDRGQVQLVDGKVTSSNMLSSEAFAAQQTRQKADEAKAAQLRAQRITEGTALKAQKLADPNFTSASPTARLAFWQDFRHRYPEVSCEDEYKFALVQQQQEQIAEQESAPATTAWDTHIDDADLRAHDQRQEGDDDNRTPPANASPSSIPPNQIPLPTFAIPTVPSLNLPTPNTTPTQ